MQDEMLIILELEGDVAIRAPPRLFIPLPREVNTLMRSRISQAVMHSSFDAPGGDSIAITALEITRRRPTGQSVSAPHVGVCQHLGEPWLPCGQNEVFAQSKMELQVPPTEDSFRLDEYPFTFEHEKGLLVFETLAARRHEP